MDCYIWYSQEEPGWAAAPPIPLLAVPNVTAHPSTASVLITVLLNDGPLLYGFNVAIKGLTTQWLLNSNMDNNWYHAQQTSVIYEKVRYMENKIAYQNLSCKICLGIPRWA